MTDNELMEIDSNEVISVNVDESKIPEIISSQIDAISKLEKKVVSADKSAKKAMEYVGGQMTRYEEKGKWIFRHRSGNTKDIIEDTQEAIEKLANAQQVSVEALQQSFEFQKKLAEVSKYLFDLGCANITVNRVAVRAIEAKLSGASKEKISVLARQEMMAVVKQLKEQEDILKKQDELKAKVKANKESIGSLENRFDKKDALDDEQSRHIENLKSAMSEKDKIDEEQSKRLEEISALLENKNLLDQRQESAISSNKESIEQIKASLKEKSALDSEQSERISKNEEAIKLIYDFIKQKDELDKKQSEEIDRLKNGKRGNAISIAAIILSICAIAVSAFSILEQMLKVS